MQRGLENPSYLWPFAGLLVRVSEGGTLGHASEGWKSWLSLSSATALPSVFNHIRIKKSLPERGDRGVDAISCDLAPAGGKHAPTRILALCRFSVQTAQGVSA